MKLGGSSGSSRVEGGRGWTLSNQTYLHEAQAEFQFRRNARFAANGTQKAIREARASESS
jgi:hypothetical protein